MDGSMQQQLPTTLEEGEEDESRLPGSMGLRPTTPAEPTEMLRPEPAPRTSALTSLLDECRYSVSDKGSRLGEESRTPGGRRGTASRTSSNGSPSEDAKRHPLVTWFDCEVRPELDAIHRKLDFLTYYNGPSVQSHGGSLIAGGGRHKVAVHDTDGPLHCGRSVSSVESESHYDRRRSRARTIEEQPGISLVLSQRPGSGRAVSAPFLTGIFPEEPSSTQDDTEPLEATDGRVSCGDPRLRVQPRRSNSADKDTADRQLSDFRKAQQEAVLRNRRGSSGGEVGERIWEFLEDSDRSDAARKFSIMQQCFVSATVALTLLQTPDPPIISGWPAAALEIACDCIFLIEFVLRMATCPNRKAFITSPYTWIDLLSALSLPLRLASGPIILVNHDMPWEHAVLLFAVPIIRLFKTLRRFQKFHLLLKAFNLAAEALPVLLFILFAIALFFAVLLYLVEQENMDTLPRAFWFTIVTMTTVGYGDISPTTDAGLTFTSILIIITVLYMAIPLGIVGEAFAQTWQDRDRILLMQRTRERLHQWGYTANDIPILFRLSDGDDDGVLTFVEFRSLLTGMHIGFSDERIQKLFGSLDPKDTGTINAQDFVRGLFPEAYHTIFRTGSEEEERQGATLVSARRTGSEREAAVKNAAAYQSRSSQGRASYSQSLAATTPQSKPLSIQSMPVPLPAPSPQPADVPLPSQGRLEATWNGFQPSREAYGSPNRKRLNRPKLFVHHSTSELPNS